ncbi:hypothetical protein RHDC4_00242 [Rhodocyclaceae bacterium]|nr:hypothetical protein RHDC4_00242 [Rhodocyclaceae bacterium]
MPIARLSASLRSLLANRALRRFLRAAGWLVAVGYFVFALLVLTLRYAVLPQIENYRGDIEAALSRSLQLPVSIAAIDAGWNGLRPRLGIRGLAIRDAAGRPALGFDNVEAELSWSSLWHFGLHLQQLEIVNPDLDIRRDAAGRYFVAGLEVGPAGGDDRFTDWLLAQNRIVVRDATLRWHDEQRGAPVLALQKLNFDLRNDGSRHRFGFTAEPPPELAARLDVRGDFRGRDLDVLESWKGDAYAELDYADLAVWRTWVDYPFDLPRGSGGLRLWLSFAQARPTAITADLRLTDVRLRLGADLPYLELAEVAGRLGGRLIDNGYEAELKRLSLATRDGIRIDPADVRLRLLAATANRLPGGEFEANGFDLGALADLAGHLPLAPAVREQLAAYDPRGRLNDLKLAWTGTPEDLKSWRLRGDFLGLALAARGKQPGFAGLSGSVEGNEKGGSIRLDSHNAALDLPAVFPEPRLALDALAAQATWKTGPEGIEINLARADFQNRDAAGDAAGRYRLGPAGGPGEIDLTAKLSRGHGNAVWRYMPLAVGKDVRDWLKAAITEGQADEATLRLRGDLAKFPFRDGKDGLFQVKGRFHGATLRYAASWPEIRDIQGELLFEGVRMLISGHKGNILGAGLSGVTAEIADLEVPEEMLIVAGKAAGPTAEFLKFIEASPVGERIDHFTEDMTAAGNGELNLKLLLPLRRIADSKVEGRYRFANNRLVPDPGLPPLTDVNGELQFTSSRLDAQKIKAVMFGAPMTVDVATAGDGNVVIKAAGSFAMGNLRQQLGHPVFDHLAGSAPWTGNVKVRKKSAEVRIESTLQGVSSSLPEPFNKTTVDSLPLVFERKPGTAGRDLTTLSLGEVLKLQLQRRTDQNAIERGAVAIGGAALRLPEKGIGVAVQAKRLDADFWRRLANGGNGGGSSAELPVTQADLRTEELIAFGRSIANLRLTAVRSGNAWKADLKSRDAAGTLEWDGRGAGRISGRLAQLVIAEAASTTAGGSHEAPEEMPAIDLAIDRFVFHGKEFGSVKLKAENAKDGYWNAKVDIGNEDASLTGEGRWRPSPTAPETRLDFKLTAKSIEKLLARMGYPDALRRGAGNAEGSLSWSGSPVGIDYPSLAGNVKFEATNGQFNKLEPGVGRLLGVISLQSLPRRLTLDFRDIFSEGFAFDAIAGDAAVTRGIMETKNLHIYGPAAKVSMSGSVNLAAETQDLKVRVQPTIGETVATGVLLAHPATGAATWVINKLFGNPLDQAFSFEYAVTGPWADPKVEKVQGPQAPAAKEAKDGGTP